MQPEVNYVATITIDAAGQITVDPDPIMTIPNKHIVFLIRNNHDRAHHVSINPFHFEKRNDTDPDSPDLPIDVFTKFFDDVDAGDVGAFVFRVRGKENFGGEPSGRYFKYKYTIKASGLADKDPDIGINN